MAMNKATLQADLLRTFLAMNDILDGTGDRYMADNVAANIKAYILTGETSTTDAGAASAGSYSGKGMGKMTVDDSSLADDLYSAFTGGYDNDGIAAHMAADIDKACSADKTVSETSTGTVTTPSGATSTFSGPAEGKFSGNKATIESALKVDELNDERRERAFRAGDGFRRGRIPESRQHFGKLEVTVLVRERPGEIA